MAAKYPWSKQQLNFIEENFHVLTNKQLAETLGIKLTHLRMQCYKMGLKRMELEYWTEEQTRYLKEHYTIYGDKELAEIFNQLWAKNKPWTLKHIEKKRKYLQLKRTSEQLRSIKDRARAKGVYVEGLKKMWAKRGCAKEGEIRYWRTGYSKEVPYIKINGRFVNWARYTWEQHFGYIPTDMNVVFVDGDPYHLNINNLQLLSNAELSKRNSQISIIGLSDNYISGLLTHKNPQLRKEIRQHKDLIELKRTSIILNRTINESTKAN